MKFTVSLVDRTNIAEQIEKYWLGRNNSHVNIQFVRFHDGKVSSDLSLPQRTDIFTVQFRDAKDQHIANAFIYANGESEIQGISAHATNLHKPEMRMILKAVYRDPRYKLFVDRQLEWFNAKPYAGLHNVPVQLALDHLVTKGWGPRKIRLLWWYDMENLQFSKDCTTVTHPCTEEEFSNYTDAVARAEELVMYPDSVTYLIV